jgi:hypothetical protein
LRVGREQGSLELAGSGRPFGGGSVDGVVALRPSVETEPARESNGGRVKIGTVKKFLDERNGSGGSLVTLGVEDRGTVEVLPVTKI